MSKYKVQLLGRSAAEEEIENCIREGLLEVRKDENGEDVLYLTPKGWQAVNLDETPSKGNA